MSLLYRWVRFTDFVAFVYENIRDFIFDILGINMMLEDLNEFWFNFQVAHAPEYELPGNIEGHPDDVINGNPIDHARRRRWRPPPPPPDHDTDDDEGPAHGA